MDYLMGLHYGTEAPYKVEPHEISINLESYDGDFELTDISELIEGFEKDHSNIKIKGRAEDEPRHRCGTSAPLDNQLPSKKGNPNGRKRKGDSNGLRY